MDWKSKSKLPRQSFVAILVISIFSSIFFVQAQTESSSREKEVSEVAVFAGCYNLALGRWWPWGLGEDAHFFTPPNRIRLLPTHGSEGFEKNGLLVRAIPMPNGARAGRGGPAYWNAKSARQIEIVWTDGFTGVTLKLEKDKNELKGWAHPVTDAPFVVPRIARVLAFPVPCKGE